MVNGQVQGILLVLVIGAATDYALLYVARYREAPETTASPLARHEGGVPTQPSSRSSRPAARSSPVCCAFCLRSREERALGPSPRSASPSRCSRRSPSCPRSSRCSAAPHSGRHPEARHASRHPRRPDGPCEGLAAGALRRAAARGRSGSSRTVAPAPRRPRPLPAEGRRRVPRATWCSGTPRRETAGRAGGALPRRIGSPPMSSCPRRTWPTARKVAADGGGIDAVAVTSEDSPTGQATSGSTDGNPC